MVLANQHHHSSLGKGPDYVDDAPIDATIERQLSDKIEARRSARQSEKKKVMMRRNEIGGRDNDNDNVPTGNNNVKDFALSNSDKIDENDDICRRVREGNSLNDDDALDFEDILFSLVKIAEGDGDILLSNEDDKMSYSERPISSNAVVKSKSSAVESESNNKQPIKSCLRNPETKDAKNGNKDKGAHDENENGTTTPRKNTSNSIYWNKSIKSATSRASSTRVEEELHVDEEEEQRRRIKSRPKKEEHIDTSGVFETFVDTIDPKTGRSFGKAMLKDVESRRASLLKKVDDSLTLSC